jgi:hypothetical protein
VLPKPNYYIRVDEIVFFFIDAAVNVCALEAEDLDDEDPEAGFRLFIADAE